MNELILTCKNVNSSCSCRCVLCTSHHRFFSYSTSKIPKEMVWTRKKEANLSSRDKNSTEGKVIWKEPCIILLVGVEMRVKSQNMLRHEVVSCKNSSNRRPLQNIHQCRIITIFRKRLWVDSSAKCRWSISLTKNLWWGRISFCCKLLTFKVFCFSL